MFGNNSIVGKREFAGDPPGTLRVTSVFYTLQGEGPLSGQPSVFVRLAHCNLACSFCDTYFDRGDVYTYAELDALIARRIVGHFGPNIPAWAQWTDAQPRGINLVITGGEPLLQDNLHGFIAFQNRMYDYDATADFPLTPQFKAVQIETNGVLRWRGDDATILVVSPKAYEINGIPQRHVVPHATTLARADCLKFVIAAPSDADTPQPYRGVPEWALEWRERTGRTIYVSPMNVYLREPRAALIAQKTNLANGIDVRSEDMEVVSFWEPDLLDMTANQRNHEYAARLAITMGYTLSLQTHLLASLA